MGGRELLRALKPRPNVLPRQPGPVPHIGPAGALPSLLWPEGPSPRRTARLSHTVATDLALDRVIHALNAGGRHERVIRDTLYDLCMDRETILYRQDILADLQGAPELTSRLRTLLPELASLAVKGKGNWKGDSPLMVVLERLGELDAYVHCIDALRGILDGAASSIRSAGLSALREGIAALADDPEVVTLRSELPALHELIAETTSVTIGVNLTAGLQPESATIIGLNRAQIRGPRTLLGRLLPRSVAGQHGQTPLREVGPVQLRRGSQLFHDLQGLLESATAPLAKALDRYRDISVGPLVALEGDLAFFTGAVALASRLRTAGIPICRPEVAPIEERVFEVADIGNVTLALQLAEGDARLVTNNACFDADGRLLILTGPNRGGKTTYCRAAGQAQVLFQCGLFVAGAHARISPADGIHTHFPLPEADQPGAGRLDEEVRRLRRIFEEATPHSLVLLNEPLTSTSERGALSIATGIVRALQVLGARVLLVTHLHDLAHRIPELNESAPPGGRIRSLVAEVAAEDGVMRGTYRVVPGVPAGKSYASEIARQHGVTFEQLTQTLADRAVAARPDLPG
jgi:hypothetical protein